MNIGHTIQMAAQVLIDVLTAISKRTDPNNSDKLCDECSQKLLSDIKEFIEAQKAAAENLPRTHVSAEDCVPDSTI